MLLKNTSKLISVAAVSMLMSSCYQGARVENMQAATQPNADFGKYTHNIMLDGASNATRWDSRVSDKNFREALANSLYSNDLLNEQNPQYELDADIVKLTPSSMGMNLHVSSEVHYMLRDMTTGELAVDKTIESRASASFSDEKMMSSRKRLVDERALNQNIEGFINYLRR